MAHLRADKANSRLYGGAPCTAGLGVGRALAFCASALAADASVHGFTLALARLQTLAVAAARVFIRGGAFREIWVVWFLGFRCKHEDEEQESIQQAAH